MTTPADLARFNTSVLRAREAYAIDTRCKDCGGPVDRHPNRLPILCADCKEDSP